MAIKHTNQSTEQKYVYIVDFTRNSLVDTVEWTDRPWLERLNRMGLVHYTHADAKEMAEQMLRRSNHSESAHQRAIGSPQEWRATTCPPNWVFSAPKWAQWAAMDENGVWKWFSVKPKDLLFVWAMEGSGVICAKIHPRPPKFLGHWRDSLFRVPGYIRHTKPA